MPDTGRIRGPVAAVAALALTGVAAAAALTFGGYAIGDAAGALARGTFGSTQVFLSVTLVRAVPLALAGLAVALAFRAGVWNIGAEGQLYAGAVLGAWVGIAWQGPGWLAAPAVLAASALAGAAWAALPALMKLRLGVGEVITTLLMNFVAIHLAGWVVRGPLQEARGVFPQTDAIHPSARLPILVSDTRLHLGFLVALAAAGALWVVLRHTRVGFAIRAAGASPEAARVAARLDTRRVVLASFLASGALAGLAGGVEVAGVTWALYDTLSPGWGYTAIAVALLAGLHPGGVVLTAILFGALEGGAGAMQRSAGIPAAWVNGVVALVILSVLAVDQGRRRLERGRGVSPVAEEAGRA